MSTRNHHPGQLFTLAERAVSFGTVNLDADDLVFGGGLF